MIANEMRRDHNNITRNEHIVMVVDTDYDRRNGFYFAVNAIGALRDQSVGDEGQSNSTDWNTVWDAKASIFDQGWMVEMVIPLQIAAVQAIRPTGLEYQPAALRSLEKRDLLSRTDRHRPFPVGGLSVLGCGHAGRSRSPGLEPEPRAQAVRLVLADDKSEGR